MKISELHVRKQVFVNKVEEICLLNFKLTLGTQIQNSRNTLFVYFMPYVYMHIGICKKHLERKK